MTLQPDETRITGHWRTIDGQVTASAECERIDELVRKWLIRRATSSDGWCVLFEDPSDGRLWELTYPHSDWHGGGPPHLEVLDARTAHERYGAWRRGESER